MIPTLAMLVTAQLLVDVPRTATNPHTTAEDIALGKKLYGGRCAGCHGPMGDGGKGTNLAMPVLPRGRDDLALWKIIRFGIPETEMPSHNMTTREIWQIAAFVRTLGKIEREPVSGDARRGEMLARGKGGCLSCHLMNGVGGELGPALHDIGTRRSPSYLRRKLLDPQRDAAGFRQVALTTKSGGEVRGVVMNEDVFSIQLREMSGALRSFWKSDLEKLSVEQRTAMPSYRGKLTESEIEDLVAYLAGLRGWQ